MLIGVLKTSILYRFRLAIFSGFAALLLVSCNGSSDDDPATLPALTSAETSYTSATVLGANVNDAAAIDAGPEVSANGLELYFHSDRAGGSGGFDLYVSTRASVSDAWGAAINIAVLNSTGNERAVSITRDGLVMYFGSDRAGGQGLIDIYQSTRVSLADPWGTPVNIGATVNTAAVESGPSISADALTLYIHSDVAGGSGQTDIYETTRASTMAAWSAPVNLGTTVNSADFDNAPEIASDGLTLYFHSGRAVGLGAQDIWRSTRAMVGDAWGIPVALGSPVNSIVGDFAPSLSDDWQIIYYTSDTGGNRDIWQAVP